MSTEGLLDALAADLKPVRRRSPVRDAMPILLIVAIELLLITALGGLRGDLSGAMGRPAFWWKLASFGLLAAVGARTTMSSLHPVGSPRRGLRWSFLLIGAALLVGWALDQAGAGRPGDLAARLVWREGLFCMSAITLLSIPPIVAIALLLRRDAATDRGGTALAAGITGAACGTFLFTWHCPHDDPLYIVVWYGLAAVCVALFARLLLPRLIRW